MDYLGARPPGDGRLILEAKGIQSKGNYERGLINQPQNPVNLHLLIPDSEQLRQESYLKSFLISKHFTSHLCFLNCGMRKLIKLFPKIPSDAKSLVFHNKQVHPSFSFICFAGKGLASLPTHQRVRLVRRPFLPDGFRRMAAQGKRGKRVGSAASACLTLSGTCCQHIKMRIFSVGKDRRQVESMLCWDREVTQISQAAEKTRTY